MNCKICELHYTANNWIEKTDHWILRHSEAEKKCQGYLYLEPIRHVEKFSEFTTNEWSEHSLLLQKGIDWIYENHSPLKIYIVTISEAVPHIHFHIVPRYIDSPKGLAYLDLALTGKLEF